jgi:flagellar basal body-associated protein FliL
MKLRNLINEIITEREASYKGLHPQHRKDASMLIIIFSLAIIGIFAIIGVIIWLFNNVSFIVFMWSFIFICSFLLIVFFINAVSEAVSDEAEKYNEDL